MGLVTAADMEVGLVAAKTELEVWLVWKEAGKDVGWVSVSCALSAPPLNGALLNTNNQNTDLIEGSVITFQCDPGFSLVGAVTVTCNNSGLWYPDPALLDCVSRSCTYTL